jgi:hypothetical protein
MKTGASMSSSRQRALRLTGSAACTTTGNLAVLATFQIKFMICHDVRQ